MGVAAQLTTWFGLALVLKFLIISRVQEVRAPRRGVAEGILASRLFDRGQEMLVGR
jgi:hypothetical protein